MPFDSAQDAENFKRLIEANKGHLAPTMATLDQITRRTLTVDQVLAEHIAGLPSITARSRADYTKQAQAHISPHLGRVAIDKLSAADVKQWLKTLAATTSSDKSLANWHGLLSAAVNSAMTAGHRTDNPCRGIRLPRRTSHTAVEMNVLTEAEWATLDRELGLVLDGKYQLFFRTLVGTGMRWGEATALQVSDLNLDITPPSVRISRATRRDENNATYIGPTKTKRSKRVVSLPANLAGQLREHVAGRRGDELVFTGATGKPLHHPNVRNRAWGPAVAAAMDPAHGQAAVSEPPRIHDLRHTHASWLLAAGVDLLTVQRRLGHESITTTADRYGHAMPGQQRAAADAIEAALS